MPNFKKISKKFIHCSVVISTIVWSLGLVVLPISVSAAVVCPNLGSGRIVKFGAKGQISIISDSYRWEFTSKAAFATWSTAAVKTINVACAEKYPKAGVVGYRPGSVLLKPVDQPGVFAVGPNNMVYNLPNTDIAKALYGANWKKLIKNSALTEFDLFTEGDDLTGLQLHDGMLVKEKNDKFVHYVWDGKLRYVKGNLPAILRKNVRIVSAELFDSVEVGDSIKVADILNIPIPQTIIGPSIEPIKEITDTIKDTVKTDTTKTTDSNSVTKDGLVYQDANYTGTFPAPEGVVVKGYYGKDEYQEPAGSGAYRFNILTNAKRELVCLDKTRTVQGSKGSSWESGYAYGRVRGEQESKLIIPYFDDTPINVSGDVNYFAEGYRQGYFESFNGQRAVFYYDCDEFKKLDLSKYDTDGWYQNTELSGASSVKAVYLPMRGVQYKKDPTNPKSLLSSKNVNTWSVPIGERGFEKSVHNTGKAPLNFSRIDLYESDFDATEAIMPLEGAKGMTEAVANLYQNFFKTDFTLKTNCSLTASNISYQTYGGNRFGLVTFVSMCKVGTNTKVWKNHAFAITQVPAKTWLITSFVNNENVKAKDTDELDLGRAQMSSEFIGQFLGKIQLK